MQIVFCVDIGTQFNGHNVHTYVFTEENIYYIYINIILNYNYMNTLEKRSTCDKIKSEKIIN